MTESTPAPKPTPEQVFDSDLNSHFKVELDAAITEQKLEQAGIDEENIESTKQNLHRLTDGMKYALQSRSDELLESNFAYPIILVGAEADEVIKNAGKELSDKDLFHAISSPMGKGIAVPSSTLKSLVQLDPQMYDQSGKIQIKDYMFLQGVHEMTHIIDRQVDPDLSINSGDESDKEYWDSESETRARQAELDAAIDTGMPNSTIELMKTRLT